MNLFCKSKNHSELKKGGEFIQNFLPKTDLNKRKCFIVHLIGHNENNESIPFISTLL